MKDLGLGALMGLAFAAGLSLGAAVMGIITDRNTRK